VREDSQLDEMRAALRGERERAKDARRRLPLANLPQEPAPEPEERRRRTFRSMFRRR